MYTKANTHRFPALVLAAGLTIAVMMGLAALAQSRGGMNSPDIQQGVAGTLFVTQAAVPEASATPLRIDVVAYRS
jgi:hypothetical protein